MKKRWAVLILSLLVAGTAVMIYCFSAQSAALSSDTSARVTRWLLQMLKRGFGDLSAVTDELHQIAVGGRAAMARDVLIDSAGVLCGALLALLCVYLAAKRARPKKEA